MYCIIICIFALCIFIHWYALSSVCLYVYVSVCLYVYVCLSQYLPPYMHAPNSFNNLNRSNPLSFFLSLSLSFSLPISLSLFLSFSLSFLIYVSLSLCVCVSASLSLSLCSSVSFFLSLPPSYGPSILMSLCICLFVCLSICVCMCRVCLFLYLAIVYNNGEQADQRTSDMSVVDRRPTPCHHIDPTSESFSGCLIYDPLRRLH